MTIEKDKIVERLIRREAEKTHRDFLQQMHPYFGLEKPPEPVRIDVSYDMEIDKALYLGRRYEYSIIFGAKDAGGYSVKDVKLVIKHSSAHETAHHLHSLFFDEHFMSRNIYSKEHKKKEMARELVAELGTLVFFGRRGNLEEYLGVMEIFEYKPNSIVYDFFGNMPLESNRETLRQISAQRNLPKILQVLDEKGFDKKELYKRLKAI